MSATLAKMWDHPLGRVSIGAALAELIKQDRTRFYCHQRLDLRAYDKAQLRREKDMAEQKLEAQDAPS